LFFGYCKAQFGVGENKSSTGKKGTLEREGRFQERKTTTPKKKGTIGKNGGAGLSVRRQVTSKKRGGCPKGSHIKHWAGKGTSWSGIE